MFRSETGTTSGKSRRDAEAIDMARQRPISKRNSGSDESTAAVDRCSPEHPCATRNDAHVSLWGSCWHVAPTSDMASESIEEVFVLETLIPSHLMLLIEDGEIAGSLTFRNEEDESETCVGMIAFDRNDAGDVLVSVTETLDPDHLLIRTSIDNVEKVMIL